MAKEELERLSIFLASPAFDISRILQIAGSLSRKKQHKSRSPHVTLVSFEIHRRHDSVDAPTQEKKQSQIDRSSHCSQLGFVWNVCPSLVVTLVSFFFF